MNLYKRAKIKENHIVDILRLKGYHAKLLEMYDSEGNEVAQTYTVNGYYKSHPDIDVYESNDGKEVILRVEVKGFENFPKINSVNLLGVESRKLEHYLELLYLSEVETRIVFVVGKNGKPDEYEYYWERLDKLVSMKSFKSKYTFDGLYWTDFIFWNPKDLNKGMENF